MLYPLHTRTDQQRMSVTQVTRLEEGTPAQHPAPPAWQARACAAYTRQSHDAAQSLTTVLIERLRRLVDAVPGSETIYVDETASLAQARIDGVLFRLRDADLLLVRPCAHCGQGLFESQPIRDEATLGHALVEWHPLHADCMPDDPVE